MSLHHTAAPRFHSWVKRIQLAFLPTYMDPFLKDFTEDLLGQFRESGHEVLDEPTNSTDIVLTTAPFLEPVSWREAALFVTRRAYGLISSPTIYTAVQATPRELEATLDRLERAAAKPEPDPADFDFPGLAPTAYRVLYEQARRGGPLMALERLVQAQAKCLRIIFVVGDDHPEYAYHFDLVGAHPLSDGADPAAFYTDIERRIATAVSTHSVTSHTVVDGIVSADSWKGLRSPAAMTTASKALGQRDFFTDPVRIADLVKVPAVSDAVASQYSEGCFATWDPDVHGLVATVTGSARPVHKGHVSEDDLALIIGVRPDGNGALVRHVEGLTNTPPSSEAVEMIAIDQLLPSTKLDPGWNISGRVPVVRSKLHGHRGIAAFDPALVEYVSLDPEYQYYPVSCASDAQAMGVKEAFARSEALHNPADPRRLVFTILPGHGLIVAEKWIAGTAPLQSVWEALDDGALVVDSVVPQGALWYSPAADGSMRLEER